MYHNNFYLYDSFQQDVWFKLLGHTGTRSYFKRAKDDYAYFQRSIIPQHLLTYPSISLIRFLPVSHQPLHYYHSHYPNMGSRDYRTALLLVDYGGSILAEWPEISPSSKF